MSAIKMNSFLNRMLKKSSIEELNVETDCEKEEQKTEAGRLSVTRGNWIKKLGNYSPRKYQVPASPVRTNTMKALDRSDLCNAYEATAPRSSRSPQSPLEMPDLESIIREFETGFMSPSKQDTTVEGCKQKNFVKKIVAAFEVKYKTYNDLKVAQDSTMDGTKLDATSAEQPKKRSGIIDSPFKSRFDGSRYFDDMNNFSPSKQNQACPSNKSMGMTPPKTNTEALKRIPGIFGSPFKLSLDEEVDFLDTTKVLEEETKTENRRSGIFYTPNRDKSVDSTDSKVSEILSSPFSKTVSQDVSKTSLDLYTSPLPINCQNPKDSSSDSSSLFKFDREASCQRSNLNFCPIAISSLDDTVTMDSIDLDLTLPEPEETIFLKGNALRKTSTMIHEFSTDEDTAMVRTNSLVDKTPKIVGAYLKKPIEVEDTSIDWIPITGGKKLPRKRSLKKLLYSLTGKKHEKKNKLFSSGRSLNEEPRELQDSGYDEKSCSSSSLTSLISITEVLLQQENSYVEPERRTTLKTFGSRNSLDEEGDEAFCDTYRATSKATKKKLLLSEIPRTDVKLDLGPSYPSASKIVTMSLDRKMISRKNSSSPSRVPLTRAPKHPCLPDIPKHPFISTTKIDGPEELQSSAEHRNAEECCAIGEPPVVVKNDLYEVEFRRSCDDICSSASCRSSSSAISNYDTPRRFLSKSESELRTVCHESVVIRRRKEPVYDIPKKQRTERPKSSVFEDAISLKRRNMLPEESVPFSMYAVPRDLKCQYATIKPRYTKVYLNTDMLRSHNNLASLEKSSAF